MLNKLLDVGAGFDWISPALALTQDILNGPSHAFSVPCDCGWSLREIGRLLRSQGIKSWGPTVAGDVFLISVRRTQARWAQAVLERNGVPLAGGWIDQPRQRTRGGHSGCDSGHSKKRSGGLLGDFWDLRLF